MKTCRWWLGGHAWTIWTVEQGTAYDSSWKMIAPLVGAPRMRRICLRCGVDQSITFR